MTRDDGAAPAEDGTLARALAATRAQLAAERELAAPPQVVARWLAAVTPVDAQAGPHPDDAWPTPAVSAPDPPTRRAHATPGAAMGSRRRPTMRSRVAAVHAGKPGRRLVLAAAALVAVLAGLLHLPAAPDVLALSRVDLAAVGTVALGAHDLGELDDPDRRSGCLRAVGIGDAPVLGGRRVVLDGRPGWLLVLGTGEVGRLRLVVVDPACGAGGGTLFADTTAGGL